MTISVQTLIQMVPGRAISATTLLLSVSMLASGCTMASIYENAANIGTSRIELTPQHKDNDDAELMARLGKTPSTPAGSSRDLTALNTANATTESSQPSPVRDKQQQENAADPQDDDTLTSAYAAPVPLATARSADVTGSSTASRTPVSEAYDKNINALEMAFAKNDEYYRSTEQIGRQISARCRRILAETGIATALLRSPTISTNVDTNENYGVGLSYDFIDLKRANLQEELAIAQCYRAAISVKLTQLLVTSTQSLTRAGFLAKANGLRNARGSFASIRSRINSAVSGGMLTQLRASTLRQYMDQISAGEAQARGEAERREVVDRILKRSFNDLDRQLVTVEGRIHDIQSRLRTVDAIKIRGQLSYGGQTNISTDSISSSVISGGRDGELTGTVQFSVRLGAFSERRHELEEIARAARQEEYFEPDSGVLWRASELARANKRVLANLREQRSDVLRALEQAKQNSRSVGEGLEEDLLMPQLRAEIDVLALRANLAGLDATIADTIRIERKLKFRG